MGDDLESGTATYLLTRPAPRSALVLGKAVAYAVVMAAAFLPAMALTFLSVVLTAPGPVGGRRVGRGRAPARRPRPGLVQVRLRAVTPTGFEANRLVLNGGEEGALGPQLVVTFRPCRSALARRHVESQNTAWRDRAREGTIAGMKRLLLPVASCSLALVVATTARAAPPEGGPELVVGAFERDEDLARVRARGATLSRGTGARAPDGEGWLVATGAAAAVSTISVVFELAPGTNLTAHDGLAFSVRAQLPERGRPARLRLRALNAAGVALFQRRLSDALRGWSGRSEPFARWRWEEAPGRWSEVRSIELVAEGALAVEVDHVRVLAGSRGSRSALPDATWLPELAFRESSMGPWVREAGAFRVVGPPSVPPDEALERTLVRLRALSVWLDRVAAAAVRPVDDGPVTVLVLPDRGAFEAFFMRVGQEWRAAVGQPPVDGYTLQDFCAISHDPAQGLERPVIIHEATHALVARRLRLITGSARTSWLHEGLANYLQMALHPASFEVRAWRRAFTRGVSDDGLFRPLRGLFETSVSLERYAQVGSLVGFLDAERPGWLGALVRGLADGQTTEAVLKALGSSVAALEADWLAWGRVAYASPEVLESGRHFPVPPEWR